MTSLLRKSSDVTNLLCVEYIKIDICAKFHDHPNDNKKVMMRGPQPPRPMSNRVKSVSF